MLHVFTQQTNPAIVSIATSMNDRTRDGKSRMKISPPAKFNGDKSRAAMWITDCNSYFSRVNEKDEDEQVRFVLDNIDAGNLGDSWRKSYLDRLNAWAKWGTTPETRRVATRPVKPYTSWEDFEKKFLAEWSDRLPKVTAQ